MTKLNKKILIIEDDEDFLYIVEKRLSVEGFSVVTAQNGQDGMLAAQRSKPDLILSDILMPQMDGVMMARKIRKFNKNVPIIFLTNTSDAGNSADAQKTDTFEYLIKSNTRIDDIVSKIKAELSL